MKSLKVLTSSCLVILLTSMQCNTVEKRIARDSSVETQVDYDNDSLNATLQINIDYPPKEFCRKTDSIQFIFSYKNDIGGQLANITDRAPFINKNKRRLLSESVRIAIPQKEDTEEIFLYYKIYRRGRYLESHRLGIETVYKSKSNK